MYEYVKFESNRSLEDAEKIFKQRIEDALFVYKKHSSNFLKRNCFICGENNFANLSKFHDSYDIVRCNVCASESVNPVPNNEALNDYYNNGKCNVLLESLLKIRYKKDSDFIIEDRVQIVLDLIEKIDKDEIYILEIGCSSGTFLSKLKYFINKKYINKKIHLSGIDIDANAIAGSVDDDLHLSVANAEEYVKNSKFKFDIILHFELIEHLPDPYVFMKSLRNLLNDSGLMFFSTPNANGLEIKAAGYNDFRLLAHAIFPPMHLNAFSSTNITHFAIRSGFKVVEITTPGKLDIDMLSHCENELDDILKKISELDEYTKGIIQYLVSYMKCSSHMRCILQK